MVASTAGRRGPRSEAPSDDDEDSESDGSLAPEDDDGEAAVDGEEAGPPIEADPFFDPKADDRDEAWLTKQRKGKPSDAILSCPSCFATLCLSCQQHERYHSQFRAMFVMNCRLAPPQPSSQEHAGGAGGGGRGGGRGQKRQKQQAGAAPSGRDATASAAAGGTAGGTNAEGAPPAAPSGGAALCRPVLCDVCETEVGVQEEDVYHFFHVLACQS